MTENQSDNHQTQEEAKEVEGLGIYRRLFPLMGVLWLIGFPFGGLVKLVLSIPIFIYTVIVITKFPVKMSPKVFVYEDGITKELYRDFNVVRGSIVFSLAMLFGVIRSADFSSSPKSEPTSLDSMVEKPKETVASGSFRENRLSDLELIESDIDDIQGETEELLDTLEEVMDRLIADSVKEYQKLPEKDRIDLIQELGRKPKEREYLDLLVAFVRVEETPSVYRQGLFVIKKHTGIEVSGELQDKPLTMNEIEKYLASQPGRFD